MIQDSQSADDNISISTVIFYQLILNWFLLFGSTYTLTAIFKKLLTRLL